jgi:hypothetical protein
LTHLPLRGLRSRWQRICFEDGAVVIDRIIQAVAAALRGALGKKIQPTALAAVCDVGRARGGDRVEPYALEGSDRARKRQARLMEAKCR